MGKNYYLLANMQKNIINAIVHIHYKPVHVNF